MPYILLVIGILIGLFALYRFMMKAEPHQIRALFLTAAILGVGLALFVLSVTGRFPAALGIIVAILPFIYGYLRNRKQSRQDTAAGEDTRQNAHTSLDRQEALEILGLEGEPSEAEIKAAYKKLMKKMHPDQEGSKWMSTKVNAARDVLLKK